MRSITPLALALCLVGVVFAAPAGAGGAPARLLVGYEQGNEEAAHLAIQAAGGHIERTSAELAFAVVRTEDPAAFTTVARLSPHVSYVEGDGATALAGGQWNGAQWNGAQWNGAQWNGAQWNGGQWNGAQWNDADLKGASADQRDAAKWTERQFQSESTNQMRWAGDATDPGLVWQWGSWAADANAAWTAGHTGGNGASVCVLDSGVAWDHPDIAPNYAAGYNAIQPTASAYDDGGHGTHIAGIAAGAVANGFGIAGVADLDILNAKVLDASGAGTESDLAFGLVWCALQDAEVAVMALSVTDTTHPTLLRALAFAADHDVLLVASAGNTGGDVQFPASDARVVAVSAVDGTLALASFSSRGPAVELAAPGVAVLSSFPGDAFVFGSGTSQAAGFAAGVAGLVRDADGSLSAAQARAILASSARDLGLSGRDASFGAGLVDVDAAVAAAVA